MAQMEQYKHASLVHILQQKGMLSQPKDEIGDKNITNL